MDDNERGEIAEITLTRSHVDTRFNLYGSLEAAYSKAEQ